MVWDEIVIGWNRCWMKVSLDEPVFGWKCRGWNCLLFWMKWFWTKVFLDESVFGWKCFWMNVFLDKFFFAIWMKVRLTEEEGALLPGRPVVAVVGTKSGKRSPRSPSFNQEEETSHEQRGHEGGTSQNIGATWGSCQQQEWRWKVQRWPQGRWRRCESWPTLSEDLLSPAMRWHVRWQTLDPQSRSR